LFCELRYTLDPPFYDKTDQGLIQKVCRGRFEFHPDCWSHVSNDAKDLIARLLIVNQEARFKVEDALNHSWLKEDEDILKQRQLQRGLTELRKFQAKRKFRAGLKAVHLIARAKTLSHSRRQLMMEVDIEEQVLPPYPYEEEFGGLMDIVEEGDGNSNSVMPPLPPK
jgi:serine/threonine protein kinase